ncbi:MAG: hypothetical protein ACRCWI_01520 [Brevinema sp.]
MFKYFLLWLLFLCTTIFAYEPGTIGVATRFMGDYNIGAVESSSHKNFAYSLTMIEFYPQKRFGLLGYTSYFQLRFAVPFTQNQRVGHFMNEFRWGLLLGGSSRVLNTINKDKGTGWSLLLNGGMTIDLPSVTRLKDMTTTDINSPINLGAELELKAVFNFHKYVAVTFGFSLGYVMTFSYFGDTVIDNIIIPNPYDLRFDQALVYGLSVGFLF